MVKSSLLTKRILDSYCDEDKIRILATTIGQPIIISKIHADTRLPQTSVYRKVKKLVDTGLLIPVDYIVINKKKITRYVAAFEIVSIRITKNKIAVMLGLPDHISCKTVNLQRKTLADVYAKKSICTFDNSRLMILEF